MTVPPLHCLCGYVADQASPAPGTQTPRDAEASAGSLTLCIKCARIYEIVEGVGYVNRRLDELTSMDPVQRAAVRRAQAAIVTMQRLRS